ncbi:MAG TPA: hypothetical protein VGH79_12110 [Gaiellaceae bacterium]|jgi:hypothetical protein
MVTRTPLREDERSRVEHEHHGLLDWAEETGLGPDEAPGEGVPWHLVLLVVLGLALLFALETALVFGIAKLVTGHAY